MSDAWLEVLSHEECVDLLRAWPVGRISVLAEDFPVVLPVNFRLVQIDGHTWIVIRTRLGNVIDQAPMPAALEVDDISLSEHRGWSVLVRGMLHHVDANAAGFRDRFDPEPWVDDNRDAWLTIEPFSITGRRLHAPEAEWAFDLRAYL
jgi:nitroimidazol reductase NimA-like FMN-containing flavoprotein (pyridoxamine 5'-phosphate oxidase superfamily)